MSRSKPCRPKAAWTKLTTTSCPTSRRLSYSAQPRNIASPYRHADDHTKDQKGPRLRGLPDELVERADLANKTISTPAGDLPMSPLMDPAFYEAKMRHKNAKAPESSVYKKVKWRRALE